MEALRIFLFSGLVLHKLLWGSDEVQRRFVENDPDAETAESEDSVGKSR